MLIKKPLEPILNQKYLRKDETSDILDTFDAPMINVSAVNPIGQTGDKITLIGKMFDDEIEGRNIDFYNGSTYLGTGKTNKYGVGIFDYTCSGAGKKEITGKWGSLVSPPCEVLDCIIEDVNNNLPVSAYSLLYNTDTLEIVNDHKEFATTATVTGRRLYLPFDNVTGDFEMRMEIKYDYKGNFGLWEGTDNEGIYREGLTNTDWKWVRFTRVDSTIAFALSEDDGKTWTQYNTSKAGNPDLTGTSFRMLLTTVSGTCYFRNLKVYSI